MRDRHGRPPGLQRASPAIIAVQGYYRTVVACAMPWLALEALVLRSAQGICYLTSLSARGKRGCWAMAVRGCETRRAAQCGVASRLLVNS